MRFRLKEPWPDFMTFFGTPATGAGWIVPKSYLLRVGDDGFKKAPVGAGPYRFVSFTPGVELVLEAHEAFWRKVPAVKRLVFRSVPDDTTRLTMLKRGEVDIAYNIRGPLAEEVKRTPGLKLTRVSWPPPSGSTSDRAVGPQVAMARPPRAAGRIARARSRGDQPGGDARVLRRPGASFPRASSSRWPAPAFPYDPAQAKKLLAEAGYPNGFDAGDYTCDLPFTTLGEAVGTYLGAVGIRARVRPLERAAFMNQWKNATDLRQSQSSQLWECGHAHRATHAVGRRLLFRLVPGDR